MKDQIKFLSKDLMAALLGIILTFAFAPYEVFPLAFISIALLFALWLDVSKERAAWLGFLFGMGAFGTGVSWIFISIHNIGGVSLPLSAFITFCFIAYLSLFPATVGYLTNHWFPTTNNAKVIFAFPALWVLSEWVRSWFLTGFPWLFLGYSQSNSPLSGFAAILGVYGVSFAVALTSALILNAALKYKQNNYLQTYFNIFIAIMIWVCGFVMSLIPFTHTSEKAIPIALVQGNIPQTIKWSAENLQLSLDTYETLTEPLWGKAKIIIWPESALPLSLQNAADFIDKLDEKAKLTHTTLILGIPIQTADLKSYHNSVITLGEYRQVYSKRLLVPFGEYTPFSHYFAGALRLLDIPMSDMVPGKYFQAPINLGKIKILTSICYEIAYPDLIRSMDKTVSFLLTVTNDAWFGKSNAQAQHLQIAQMRAIEMGRPVVFVSNDGITAIIGADGKIASQAPPHQTIVLEGKVEPMQGSTLWMRFGSDPILFLSLCFLIYAIRLQRREAFTKKEASLMTTKTS